MYSFYYMNPLNNLGIYNGFCKCKITQEIYRSLAIAKMINLLNPAIFQRSLLYIFICTFFCQKAAVLSHAYWYYIQYACRCKPAFFLSSKGVFAGSARCIFGVCVDFWCASRYTPHMRVAFAPYSLIFFRSNPKMHCLAQSHRLCRWDYQEIIAQLYLRHA